MVDILLTTVGMFLFLVSFFAAFAIGVKLLEWAFDD